MNIINLFYTIHPKYKDGTIVLAEELHRKESCIISYVEDQLLKKKMVINTFKNDAFGMQKRFTLLKTVGRPEWDAYLTLKYDSEYQNKDSLSNQVGLTDYYRNLKEFNETLSQISYDALKECNSIDMFELMIVVK